MYVCMFIGSFVGLYELELELENGLLDKIVQRNLQ